jgi:hypothetical protein
MTPREKAKELVDVMRDEIPCHCDDWEQAKQCALIAVNEIIFSHMIDGIIDYDIEIYWDSVIEEIEKL